MYLRDAYKWSAVIRYPGSARPNRTALPQWTPDIYAHKFWATNFVPAVPVFGGNKLQLWLGSSRISEVDEGMAFKVWVMSIVDTAMSLAEQFNPLWLLPEWLRNIILTGVERA